MSKLILGYDDNLGLPKDFSQKIACETRAYHDLSTMLIDFNKHNLTAIFIPAGTLPYITDYKIISQAIFKQGNKTTLETDFVSLENLSVAEVANGVIGRVNQYCTTSYWAPRIYLMNFLSPDTFLKFQDTNGFQDMLHKTATGKILCSMVWNIILQQNPNDADRVHMFFKKSDLPTPIIITKETLPDNLIKQINTFKSEDESAFFNAFAEPDKDTLNKFLAEIKDAASFYNLNLPALENLTISNT